LQLFSKNYTANLLSQTESHHIHLPGKWIYRRVLELEIIKLGKSLTYKAS